MYETLLHVVPSKYSFKNGTNPRDQIEAVEILNALSAMAGVNPSNVSIVPPSPPSPTPSPSFRSHRFLIMQLFIVFLLIHVIIIEQ